MLPKEWRYQRFHISHLLAALALGSLAGLCIGRSVEIQFGAIAVIAVLSLLLGGFRSQRWWAMGSLLFAGIVIGLMRGNTVDQHYDRYAELIGDQQTVTGAMTGDAQQLGTDRQRVVLGSVQAGESKYPGEIFVTVYGGDELKRGDRVTVRGMVREGFASYGIAMSAGRVVSVQRGDDMIRDVRERFGSALRQVVIDPIASLGLGFVVGQRSALPDTLDEQLRVVGLTHIVVASGYNLTILVRFMMRVFSRYSRYLALMSSLAAVVLFVLFSGFSPSMNRAAVVTILGLLAWYVGRRFHPLLLIFYVAAATALWNPMYLWSDLGWYLSFFAFFGVLIIAPLVLKLVYRRRSPTAVEQLVTETLGAEVMTLPLIVFAFGTLPVLGLVSNALVAPFIPAAMALTAITGVLAMAIPILASLFALPTMILIGYMIAVVEWLAELPFAEQRFGMDLTALIGWYVVVVISVLFMSRRIAYDFRRRDHRLDV